MNQTLAIMLGGAFGALFRYLLANGVYELMGRQFPWGTLAVNVLGSFLMGFLSLLFVERWDIDPALKLMILVGFLGSFTTFSTFSLDTLNLIQQGQSIRALLNSLLNVVLCVLAVWLGLLLARRLL